MWKELLILLVIYVAQILIVLVYPYYMYRRDCKGERTIEGLMSYMKHKNIGGLKACAFIPYFGLAALIMVLILGIILSSIIWIYENFIKNVKI